jgi:hypothetical protein
VIKPESTKSFIETVEAQGLPSTTAARLSTTGSIPETWEVLDAKERAAAIKEKSDAKNETRERREEIKKQQRMEAEAAARAELERQRAEGEANTYPNLYYAGPQIALFIGDRWVADAITISYTETVNKTPLYGYASTRFDAVAKGTVLVQGQLAIAYTTENYLNEILSNYRQKIGRIGASPLSIADPIERAKVLFWKKEVPETTVSTVPLEYGYRNGVDGHVERGFDICVYFGGQEFIRDSVTNRSSGVNLKTGGHMSTISDVHLTSRGISVTPSGEPIAEIYSFFASGVTAKAVGRVGTRTVSVPMGSSGLVPVAGVNGVTSFNQQYISNLKGR